MNVPKMYCGCGRMLINGIWKQSEIKDWKDKGRKTECYRCIRRRKIRERKKHS